MSRRKHNRIAGYTLLDLAGQDILLQRARVYTALKQQLEQQQAQQPDITDPLTRIAYDVQRKIEQAEDDEKQRQADEYDRQEQERLAKAEASLTRMENGDRRFKLNKIDINGRYTGLITLKILKKD